MSLDTSVFAAVAPEYSSLDAAGIVRRDVCATVAESEISEAIFLTRYDLAVALLTAHYMKVGDHSGAGGAITMEKVGDLQRQYEPAGLNSTNLDSTAYGKQFKRIRSQVVITANVY